MIAFPAGRPFDVVGIGVNSVDTLVVVPDYPQPGSRNEVINYGRDGGGQVATALVCQARLGLRVKYLGKVGDDADGAFSEASLRTHGVDTSDVVVVPGCHTQFAYILVSGRNGERTICSHHEKALQITPADFSQSQVDGATVFHLDTHNIDMNIELARHAQALGIPVLIDAEAPRQGIDELLSLCSIVVADLRFSRKYTGETEPGRMLEVLRRRTPARIVGITLGEAGSIAWSEGEIVTAPAYRIDVCDTTGAGDTFHGAFGYALLRGWPLDRMLRFANAVAALKCRGLGGRATLPRLEEVEALMQESLDPDLPPRSVLPPHPVIDDAWAFAREAHRGRLRDESEPYFLHAVRVARTVVEDFVVTDPEVVAIALLHDVLQDVPVEHGYFRGRFGSRIYNGVRTLTKDGRLAGGEREARYLTTLDHASPDILTVKIADRVDNLTPTHLQHVDGTPYVDVTRETYVPLARRAAPRAEARLVAALEGLAR